jgi:hypothetical protein
MQEYNFVINSIQLWSFLWDWNKLQAHLLNLSILEHDRLFMIIISPVSARDSNICY